MREGWEYKKLGEVCNIICGQDYKNVESPDGKYPIYGTGGIMGYANQYRCPACSVIVGRKGSINNPIYVEENYWNVDTAFGIVPSKENLFPKFFFYFCKNYDFTKHNVAVTIPSLRRIDLLKILTPVPSLPEQERIVSELDLLSSIIEKKKAQLQEYDQLAQSIFYDMFGDLEYNTKSFVSFQLGKVCSLKAGKAIKADELFEKAEGLYPCYGGNGIRGYINKWSHSGMFPIIGRQGALCGNVNLALGYFYATEHAVVVSPIIDINTLWLYYALISMKLGQYAHGVAQPGLSIKDLLPISIPLPPLSLQQQFAEKIEAIEKQKEQIKQSIAEVETLFNSRMDYYFN